MMKKLDGLQIGRATAVFSVLVFHLTGLSAEYAGGCFYRPWTEVLRAGVDVFFVISGVVMVVTTYEKFGMPGSARRFIVHRISRIYPPYLVLTMLLAVMWIIWPGSINRTSGGANFFESFTLWPSPHRLPLVQVGWTLSFEMMFYLAFFSFMLLLKRAMLGRALVVWSALTAIGCAAIHLGALRHFAQAMPRVSFVVSPYVLEFVMGCFLGLAYNKGRLFPGRWFVSFSIFLFTLEAVAFQLIGIVSTKRTASDTLLRVAMFGPPAALLVWGLLSRQRTCNASWSIRKTVACGNVSYSIYLIHLLVIHCAYRYTFALYSSGAMRSLFLIVTPAIALAASWVFYRTVEMPLSLWVRTRLEDIVGVQHRSAIDNRMNGVLPHRPAPAE